ncbi:MAG: hypothetical protein M1836_008178 [Candelina mexicana]|nr:MAG: hypothetical protein M1836_008178 [Candelina mexicana]
MSWFSSLLTPSVSTVIVTIASGILYVWWPERSNKPAALRRSIPAPRETLLPHLSAGEIVTLPYPPDLLPGGRNVETLYGVMRVYEWGPKDGMKVLLIHGDTTPAPVLGPIASQLVDRGCRVMVFDLWGRGYSDTPLGVPYDSRLFTTQIFFALASSSLSWTGAATGGFSMIGFSLGGGVTMSFAAHFPYLVNSIVLLAPAGVLRYMPKDYKRFSFRYPSLVPSNFLRLAVGKALGVTISKETGTANAIAEVDRNRPQEESKTFIAGKDTLDIPGIVQWQFDYHKGFCHSFANTIYYGPIMNQESDWVKACDIIKGESSSPESLVRGSKIWNSKILIMFGDADDVVVAKDVMKELDQLLGGPEHVTCGTVPGGHGFPVPSCDEVVEHICRFWHI